MAEFITIRFSSMQLMEALRKKNYTDLPLITEKNEHKFAASRQDIVLWLTKTCQIEKQHRFLLESLRAELLEDLYLTLPMHRDNLQNTDEPQETNSLGYFKYALLMIAGTVFAICEGYDVITSMLGLFSGIPSLLVFTVGAAFSLLSIVLFYGFDLVEISKNLNVKLNKSPQLLDVFLKQIEQINKIRKYLHSECAETQSTKTLLPLKKLAQMLTIRFNDLDEPRQIFINALDDPYLNAMKFTTAVFAGAIYFGIGFFASQQLALGVVSLFIATATPLCLPVVLLSSLVGLAAFGVYWHVQRPGLENLVGRWVGLDREDIDLFADPTQVASQKNALTLINRQISQCLVTARFAAPEKAPSPNKITRSFSADDLDYARSCMFFNAHEPSQDTSVKNASLNAFIL